MREMRRKTERERYTQGEVERNRKNGGVAGGGGRGR